MIGRGRQPRLILILMAHRLNTPDGPAVLHYVTLNVRDRKRAFSRPEYAAMMLDLLRFECDRHPAMLAAYVVMPDHLHFLFGPQDGKVTRFLARLKPNATRNLDALAIQSGRIKEHQWLTEKGKRELWQDGKYSLPIYSPQWITEKLITSTIIRCAPDWSNIRATILFPVSEPTFQNAAPSLW